MLVALSLALARGADSHIDLAQLWLASYVLYRDAAGNAAFYAEISHGPDSTLLGIGAKIIASASPLTLDLGNIRRIEDAGGAAVVLPSLFEEQIAQAHYTRTGPEARAEAFSYLPLAAEYRTGPHEYLDLIKKARESVSIPIIASLNGVTGAGWTGHARLAQQAGASAIELNVFLYLPTPSLDAAEVEQRYIEVLRAVKAAVSIPVSMKLNPDFSAPAHTIRVLERAGADGFVLFNRFYQPDFDLTELTPRLTLHLPRLRKSGSRSSGSQSCSGI